jgi:hypothetical protein
MTKQITHKTFAAAVAAVTTLVLFSAVAGLADSDRAATLAAQIKPTTIAAAR